ncbi:MAG TPA: hypothetical protein VEI52_18220 [Terriglobales bacterium]|nr:hypothetical protein [Terriglobales bacterium]
MKRQILIVSLVILGLSLLTVNALAQTSDPSQDAFKVNYFANNGVAGAPDATVRIDNPGSPTGVEPETASPSDSIGDIDLCAMIYVFDNDQQLSECCGCLVTPNGLRALSVTHDLTANPLTGVVSNNGDILIVSALPNATPCDPAGAEGFKAVPTVRAWGTHIQNKVGTAYPITETPFTDVTLTKASTIILEECAFVQRLGSGHGVCGCGTGD